MPLYEQYASRSLKFATDRLIAPGMLSPRLTLTRAQTGGVQSSAFAGDNTTYNFFGADVPRFNGPNRRLEIEGQRTNLLLNSATLSTQNVTVTNVAHTLSFRGTGSITRSGTSTGTTNGAGALNRVSVTFTPTAGTLTLTVSGTVTEAQLEVGSFATSYIPTTSAAATRGADLISASLSSLGIGANGACTVLGSFVVAQAAPSGVDQSLIEIDAGAATNRYLIRMSGGGLSVNLFRVTAGSGTGGIAAGTAAAGSLFRAGITVNSAGRVAASFNGAACVSEIGGPTSGLTTLRIGNNAGGVTPMNGDLESAIVFPFSVSDTQLANMVASFY